MLQSFFPFATRPRRWACLLTMVSGTLTATLNLVAHADDGVRTIAVSGEVPFAPSVVVTGRELVHTTQLLPLDENGELVGPDAPGRQIQQVLNTLVAVLAAQQARPDDIVKLNFYLADETLVPPLFRAWQAQFPEVRPAMSMVATTLPIDGALIAVDAVAARTPAITDSLPVLRHEPTVAGRERLSHSAVLPVGETIYISGQAEPGADLAAATAATLAGLHRTLEHLDLGLEHVVQLKCFLEPMADAGAAYHEIEKLFGERPAPPTSVVEWISSLPIEIEMIVHSPVDTPGTGVTHEWLPWLTNSPVYCRLSRVHSPSQVFVSGCFGTSGDSESRQVAEVFDLLQERLTAAGSDLRHMAKATYYVTNEAASAAVNEIRPNLYDPEHPPAASKALVNGVAQRGGTFTLDMIAVPTTD